MSDSVNKDVASSLAGAVTHTQGLSVTLDSGHPMLLANGLVSGSSVTLCQYWPLAKPVIITLQKFLPTWTAWIIQILISVGDKACPGT